jgi:hypothetical protein
MHIKTRGQRAMLYRSVWIKKGAEGNTHGFARQTYVASIPVDSVSMPTELVAQLSPVEAAYLQKTLVEPARAAAAARLAQVEYQRRDPVWRLEDAVKLVREAAVLSADAVVPQGRIKALTDALATVKTIGGSPPPQPPRPEAHQVDPLAEALKAIRAAAQAVRGGHYGSAPVDGARRSSQYEDRMGCCALCNLADG